AEPCPVSRDTQLEHRHSRENSAELLHCARRFSDSASRPEPQVWEEERHGGSGRDQTTGRAVLGDLAGPISRWGEKIQSRQLDARIGAAFCPAIIILQRAMRHDELAVRLTPHGSCLRCEASSAVVVQANRAVA